MWRVPIKLFAIVIIVLLAMPSGLLVKTFRGSKGTLEFSRVTAKCLAWVIGLRVIVRGQMSDDRPLLIASNHISYLDIIALGASAPLTFTPKSEIANWPVIGQLCRIIGCVFVDRRKSKTKENLANLHTALDAGKPLVLFVEGTTSDGKRLLPVRSSYFQLAESFENDSLNIQPVLIRYERVHNLPIDEVSRHKIAWVGDQELLPHIVPLLQLGPITVSVNYLDALDISNCKTRKEMAHLCEKNLAQALGNLP